MHFRVRNTHLLFHPDEFGVDLKNSLGFSEPPIFSRSLYPKTQPAIQIIGWRLWSELVRCEGSGMAAF
jgi:hypothetical protein